MSEKVNNPGQLINQIKNYPMHKLGVDSVIKTIKDIMAQKEEILTAFIAKYGCQPDEIEQVEQRTEDGTVWYVRKRQSTGEG